MKQFKQLEQTRLETRQTRRYPSCASPIWKCRTLPDFISLHRSRVAPALGAGARGLDPSPAQRGLPSRPRSAPEWGPAGLAQGRYGPRGDLVLAVTLNALCLLPCPGTPAGPRSPRANGEVSLGRESGRYGLARVFFSHQSAHTTLQMASLNIAVLQHAVISTSFFSRTQGKILKIRIRKTKL